MWVAHSAAILAISAFVCAGLVVILRPWLERYALARPNARSSHREPTPQGGGIAVIIATVAGACFGISGFDTSLGVILAATMIIACAGAAADIRPITIALRLGIQTIAVALVIFALPDGLRVAAFLPWWVERGLLLVAGLWFVNLVNFMDGLDWMTVAEVVPVTGTLAAIGFMGLLPAPAIVVSLALCGAMIGFAYFNRPVARLFLGDVGSLPIGLVIGWLLVLVGGHGGHAAAILLPLYYVADSTITLLWSALNHENIWEAHRSHFYQRATDRGFSVIDVVTRVFIVNLALAALALLTIVRPSHAIDAAALAAGGTLVAWLLFTFSRGRK
jgi:UDP-N-acetylmuramyl pentapeptide phosphotransferase/UDP-N-acetylglucosamine-1-phosphate transferase